MKKLLSCLLIFLSSSVFAAQESNVCTHWISFLKPICERLHHIWVDGNTDLYLSGYAWHNRYTYPPEKVRNYNEAAWGGGLGKSLFDKDGDWQGIYAIAFLDSHKNLEPAAGYAFLKVAHFSRDFSAGLGYSILVTMRPDINNGYPFPGLLPWVSVFYKKSTIAATYIPGARGAGNVLYIIGKYSF
jgi:palmitoyl transferase